MKILMVSSYLPYPLHSGGQVRLFNLIKELSDKHEITLICEKRQHQTEQDVAEVEKICKKIITVERKRQWGIRNIFKTSVSLHSFLVTGHTHPELKQKILDELALGNFDLIHAETFYVMQNLPETNLPIVLVEHNIEYQVYKRFVDKSSIFVRPLLMLDIAKIKRDEVNFWKNADQVIAVSGDDAEEMRRQDLNPKIVPNGVDIKKFYFEPRAKSQEPRAKKILFIGDFKWLQNRDSAKFIIKEIWPLFRQEAKSKKQKANLWIVGKKIPETIRLLAKDSDIIFDEAASENPTEQIFQTADILLAPIRIGGGTSFKILESMSCGTPVVTMQMSAKALGAQNSQEIMTGDSAAELVDKINNLLDDYDLYKKIAKNGRQLIEEKYTWKKIAVELEKVYKGLGTRD